MDDPRGPVCRAEDIGEGAGRAVTVDGVQVAVFRHRGALYALRDECPHRQGPLSAGRLEDGCVICPLHGWRFELASGRRSGDLRTEVETYQVEEEDGQVFVRRKP